MGLINKLSEYPADDTLAPSQDKLVGQQQRASYQPDEIFPTFFLNQHTKWNIFQLDGT